MKYLLFTLIVLLDNVYATEYQSRLCSHRRNYSRNCSRQLRTHSGYCIAEIQRNNTLCEKWDFSSDYSTQDRDQHMTLKTYCFDNSFYTLRALNITFKTDNWTEGMFRFTVLSDSHTVCVKFNVNSTNLIDTKLFYDCVWYDKNLDNLDVLLEYQLKGENEVYISNGKYKMYLPPCALYGSKNKVSNFHTMVYVNQNDLPKITLHIQKMPIIFNITKYRIKMCAAEYSEGTILDYGNQSCVVKKNLNTSADDDELLVHLQMSEYDAAYFFVIEAKHEDCNDEYCFVARSPSIQINTNHVYLYIIVSIMLGSIFIGILLLILKAKLLVMFRIKVLLLHDPVHSLHTNVVKNLATAMKMYNIDVLLDVTDIHKSDIKNPVVWYSKAVSEVKYVVVVSTPKIEPDSDAIFKDLYAIGLRFANEAIKNKSSNLKIINILPPYCNTDDIPPVLKHYKKFKLMKQFSQMVRHLQSLKMINLSLLCRNKKIELRKDFKNILFELSSSINEMKEISSLNKKKGTPKASLHNVNNYELCTTCLHDLQTNSSNKPTNEVFVEFVNVQRLNLDGESEETSSGEFEALLIQPNSVHSLDL